MNMLDGADIPTFIRLEKRNVSCSRPSFFAGE
jgi:hypothetical protein